jgi:parallel beta-helix repeat protein
MNKKIIAIGIIFTLFLTFLQTISVSANNISSSDTLGNIIYVNPGESIQNAIDFANDGDTVFVYSGTYFESIAIRKSITLEGQNRESTIIDLGLTGEVLVSSSYVTVKGFTVRNCVDDGFSSGIHVVKSFWSRYPREIISDITISDCIVENNGLGIRFTAVENFEVSNCIIRNTAGHSIYNVNTVNGVIKNSDIYNNGEEVEGGCYSGGIIISEDSHDGEIWPSKNIKIFNCEIFNNIAFGIDIGGSENIEIYDNEIYDNSMAGLSISGSGAKCNDIYVHDNILTNNNWDGIKIQETSDTIIIESNQMINNKNGIFLAFSKNNEIKNNIISENEIGIKLRDSPDYRILDNTISHNSYGVQLIDCSYNLNDLKEDNEFSNNGQDLKSKEKINLLLARIFEILTFLKNLLKF